MRQFKFWRRFKGGIWYYVRPYDNLYDFTHMRYWINRNPSSTEVILNWEAYPGKQTTFVCCPHCGIEMISNNYCVEDTDLVRFHCRRCNNKSEYLFDSPVPILISKSVLEATP